MTAEDGFERPFGLADARSAAAAIGRGEVKSSGGERRYDEQPFWTAQPAVAGLPALAAPAGRTQSGLPVGVQIVGPHHGDHLIIDIAELLDGILGSAA